LKYHVRALQDGIKVSVNFDHRLSFFAPTDSIIVLPKHCSFPPNAFDDLINLFRRRLAVFIASASLHRARIIYSVGLAPV